MLLPGIDSGLKPRGLKRHKQWYHTHYQVRSFGALDINGLSSLNGLLDIDNFVTDKAKYFPFGLGVAVPTRQRRGKYLVVCPLGLGQNFEEAENTTALPVQNPEETTAG